MQYKLNEGGIKAARFVGQAKREFDIGMSQEEQSTVLESFRNGEFDVLVTTSIAEEGQMTIPDMHPAEPTAGLEDGHETSNHICTHNYCAPNGTICMR